MKEKTTAWKTKDIDFIHTAHWKKLVTALGKSQSQPYIKHITNAGHIAQNELDTHADTSCAGVNWALLELTSDICEVTPFLDSYEPINEISLACCGMVWTDPMTTQDFY